ncbi:polysaccharide deacetylase family protein [Chitinophaga solisilvae]|uniref:polysaccharide deacetylase family protein n=1 Tax=Chitinophaga solisilvae TaxID=1233460 RepID=UPI00136AB176|nr:polysaccharide deacetylase family protein [Chitinophaga solisilvae]
MKQDNRILISVDVEEFDIPEAFGRQVPLQEKLEISRRGLQAALQLFEKYQVRATFFITAYWAQHYPELIRQLALHHEIASHAYYHSSFAEQDMEGSRLVLQEISGQQVRGFRMPGGSRADLKALLRAGYSYDASLNPTWLPGHLNHRREPRTMYRQDGMWIIPSSVSPLIRYPVFWLTLKNTPLWMSRHFSKVILQKDHYLSFQFHPWELVNIREYNLPGYISRISGAVMQQKLERYLIFLQQQGRFCAHIDML